MLAISSAEGYPKPGDLFFRTELFIVGGEYGYEGGIFIIGKDKDGIEYIPKDLRDDHSYYLPSGSSFRVPMGPNPYPAMYFQFKLRRNYPSYQMFLADLEKCDSDEDVDRIIRRFDILVCDAFGSPITIDTEAEWFLKGLGVMAAQLLAEGAEEGRVANHAMFDGCRDSEPKIEKLLEAHRKK